jgi:sec-independent protein translocase protein TatC
MATTIENPPPPSPNPDPDEVQLNGKQMSFLEHLEELRRRLVRSALSIFVGFGVCFYFRNRIFDYLARPLTQSLHDLHLPEKLVYTNPTDPFNLYIKLSIVAGIFLVSPYILWQVWLFISPGLYRHEKRYVWPFVLLTSGLFITGGFFAQKMAIPAALKFLLEFGRQFQPMVTINEYLSLVTTLLLGVGLVFELPVIVLVLSVFGIVTPKFLIKNVRYAVLLTAVTAAALAPTPDWTTLFMFWIPMVGLYVVSIGLSWLVHARKKWRAKRAAQSDQ